MYDVLVLGAGPSGSTAAHLLADGGARVLAFERATFPHFRIGESLLPANTSIFERLGVDPSKCRGHLKKLGAEFFDESAGRHATYRFSDSLSHTRSYAWQVDRAELDLELVRLAEAAGAEVHQGEKAIAVETEDDCVRVQTERGTYEGRYLLDATGQESFLARKHRTRRRIETFGLAAVYRHFERLRPAIQEELARDGHIKVLFRDDGWLWAIPLGRGRLSVGLVTREKGIADDWLDAAILASPELTRLLEGAEPIRPHQRVGSFSFFNQRSHGPRWACIGDAACFLDPIFSSGVTFAMIGASQAADVLGPALQAGREADPTLMDAHAAHMSHGYSVFATLIQSFYDRRLLPDLLFTSSQDPMLRKGLTSVLAGEVWQPDNPFQEKLWASQRRRFEFPREPSGEDLAEDKTN